MQWTLNRPLVWCAVAVIGTAPACSSVEKTGPPVAPSPSVTTTAVVATRPSGISLSPAGVTTKIDVPAHSTEEEYSQACHAADTWMKAHPQNRQTLVEGYLAAVQQPGIAGPGTWNTAWAALTLPRQAGVIVAAKAAANGECG